MCTFDVLSVEEKCMGLECRRKGLEESCPLHVGRTGGRWIEMDWRTARPSGPQVGGIHISVLHHIVFSLQLFNATMHFALYYFVKEIMFKCIIKLQSIASWCSSGG